MTDVLRGLRLRLQMSKWLWLGRWRTWNSAIEIVHGFIDRQIDQTYQEKAEKLRRQNLSNSRLNGGSERTDLLWNMVGNLPEDRERLRSEMLLLFVPNNDTTSIFISNVFWNLARLPEVYAKVREEVLALGEDTPLTYETLRTLKYLEAVLNESKLILFIVTTWLVYALTDTFSSSTLSQWRHASALLSQRHDFASWWWQGWQKPNLCEERRCGASE